MLTGMPPGLSASKGRHVVGRLTGASFSVSHYLSGKVVPLRFGTNYNF
ncbi:MAG: hypothetical protein V8R07_08715 [Bacteroides fragilis]